MAQKKIKYQKRNPQPTPPVEKPVKKAKAKKKEKDKPGAFMRALVKMSETKLGRSIPYLVMAALILVVGVTAFFSLYKPATAASDGTSEPVTSDVASAGANSDFDREYQLAEPAEGEEIAVMHTTEGDVKIRFFPNEAPKAVENFIKHAKDGYYDGVLFHRVINDFMIQSGDPKGDGTGGESIWGEAFKNEISPNLLNIRGALAMANSGPDTNGSQFFINQTTATAMQKWTNMTEEQFKALPDGVQGQYYLQGGNPFLDGSYTVFGQVLDGMDVVDKIAAAKTGSNDKPTSDIKITSVDIESYKKA